MIPHAVITPAEFIAKWGPQGTLAHLNEEQGAQQHFLELCDLLGVPTPGSGAGASADYVFEQRSLVLGAARGYADVFYRGHFAWENKAPGKNLDAALRQLLQYALALDNPPLLVVCDRLTIRIHTQFTGYPSETWTIGIADLADPAQRALLARLWTDPESFKPAKSSRAITEEAAQAFATLAAQLQARGSGVQQVAHFLTQCVFCFFAEDVGLLPGKLFEHLVDNRAITPAQLAGALAELFGKMQTGGLFGADAIPWFNGGLFEQVDVPALQVTDVTALRNAAALNWSAIDVSIFGTLFERGLDPAKRSQLGAHYTDPATIARIIDPVIVRPLRAQWAAAKADIARHAAKIKKNGDAAYRKAHARFVQWLSALSAFRILDPACGSGNFLFLGLKALKDVELLAITEAAALGLDREQDLVTGPHNMLGIELNPYAAELARASLWIGELQWRIAHGYPPKTDPVLQNLDQIECRDALIAWDPPLPGPLPQAGEGDLRSSSGICQERCPVNQAASPSVVDDSSADSAPSPRPLAGEGQGEGASNARRATEAPWPRTDVVVGSAPSPRPLAGEGQGEGVSNARRAAEAPWPRADVVVGNPPFVGDKAMRRELGDVYVDALRTLYADRVPGNADLVTFWFARAGERIGRGVLQRAGLVATNSIRQRGNRPVLAAIAQVTRIFEAWSDEPWVNAGAAVRVSLVCFGASGQPAQLDGTEVAQIFTNLQGQPLGSAAVDLTRAQPLAENADTSFFGFCLAGKFKIPAARAAQWLQQPNVNGRSNADVLKPIYNGRDVTDRWRGHWVIDFGTELAEADAALYEAPFAYLLANVKPVRAKNNRASRARWWWRFGEARPGLRDKLRPLQRYIATVETAKHRVFVFFPISVAPEHSLIIIPRADDATFGVLSSRFHILWALARGGTLEDRPRYNSIAAFRPFPFPAGLTPADTADQQTEALASGAQIPAHLPDAAVRAHASAIAEAAHRLDTLRQNWLNPPEWTRRVSDVVPLGMEHSPYPDRIEPRLDLSAADAQALKKRTLTALYNQHPAWLAGAHAALDAAVAAAYGWADYTPALPEAEILRRLLALNLQRAAAQPAAH